MAPERGCRALMRLAGSGLMVGVAGCATLVDIQALATARVDQAAYELRGVDLAPLQREAQRLCPAGAEVLRQAVQGQFRPIDSDSRAARWLGRAGQWIDPPQRQAQLVVLCHATPQDRSIAPGVAQQPADAGLVAAQSPEAAAAAPGEALAAAPIGPVMPEW